MSRSDTPSAPAPDHSGDADFDAIWELADTIPGWLKRGQARLLFDEARQLPRGARVLEIGSHQGRSTVVLAKAVEAIDGRVTCVDPFVEGRLFGGIPTKEKFERNLATTGIQHLIDLVPDYSTRLRPQWSEPFDLLYIDGKHDYWTLSDDLRWATHLPEGGAVLVHDAYSSIGVTLGILAHVLPSRTLRYALRSDSMALFFRSRPTAGDRLRILAEMPWWVRNVFVKLLLRLRLRPLARILGHDSPYDPY